MPKQFEVGKTYYTRSMNDYDYIHSFEILSRTAKTVTVLAHGNAVLRRLHVYEGVESFKPFGNYSMCVVVHATHDEVPT